MINKRPTSSTASYTVDVNGSINCSTNFSCSGSISSTGSISCLGNINCSGNVSSTRSLTSSSGNLTFNNGRIYASNSSATNHFLYCDIPTGNDARQLVIGSNSNNNLFLSLGISTGTNLANSAQSSYCVIQGNLSGNYYTPLTLNAQGGTVFVNKFPSAGVTGSNLDVNGRIDCTNLYLNGRDTSSTLPNSFFITSPEVDNLILQQVIYHF